MSPKFFAEIPKPCFGEWLSSEINWKQRSSTMAKLFAMDRGGSWKVNWLMRNKFMIDTIAYGKRDFVLEQLVLVRSQQVL